jgi:dipeptidyl aminopeptidase/acylaminoacyl peptidase
MSAVRVRAILLVLLSGLAAGAAEPSAPSYPDRTHLLVYRDRAGGEHPVRTPDDWPKRRAHILAHMQEVMGPLPDGSRKVPLAVEVVEEVRSQRFVRRKLTFVPEKGDRVPAYLFLPLGHRGKRPAVLCLHQTNGKLGKAEPAGLGGRPNQHYARELAERGYVTLAPDYPNFGEYHFDVYEHGYQSATMKAIWNTMRAIDLLQSLPEVDPQRIGCIGHSLGGHNTMFTAAFDVRIKALVSSCGFTSFPKYYRGDLKGWSHNGYMPRIASVYEKKPAKMPFDFPEVVAAFAPRAFFTNSPLHDDNFEVSGVRDCLAAARPVYELLSAREKLTAIYPDCQHDFPPEAREKAYQWLDRWLKGS